MSVIDTHLEPVRTAVYGLITALLTLLTAFGVALTDAQITAILGFVAAASVATVAVVELFARRRVTPVASPHDEDGHALITIGSYGRS